MTDAERCPLCGTGGRSSRASNPINTLFDCRCCGRFEFCDQDFQAGWAKEPYYLISHFLRRRHDATGEVYLFSDREGNRFPENLADLPVSDKLILALLWVAKKTSGFGVPSSMDLVSDWPIAQVRNYDEFARMMQHWQTEKMLEPTPMLESKQTLTGKGWSLVEELQPSRKGGGKQAFVAMSFHDEFKSAYDYGIEPALMECGWEPVRVDREDFEGKICDHIISEIRRSDLVIVECTGSKPNVYFEAGFAMGLGIPVVWCVRKEELDKNEVAFDTRQYPHLGWENEEVLRSKLIDRIGALYPLS